MEYLDKIGRLAKEAERELRTLSGGRKNEILERAAVELTAAEEAILAANAKDMEAARARGMSPGLLDRLALNPARIRSMADGLRQVAALEDPVGEVLWMNKRPNGLLIGQKRVPLGVVGIIYEARPNVTADAFGLCFKSGNVAVLKGGSDAIHSNRAIVEALRRALAESNLSEGA